jgi:hypothetical protein
VRLVQRGFASKACLVLVGDSPLARGGSQSPERGRCLSPCVAHGKSRGRRFSPSLVRRLRLSSRVEDLEHHPGSDGERSSRRRDRVGNDELVEDGVTGHSFPRATRKLAGVLALYR